MNIDELNRAVGEPLDRRPGRACRRTSADVVEDDDLALGGVSGNHYDVYTSTTAGDPPVPSESTLTELDPVGPRTGPPLLLSVAQGLGRVFAWGRGHLKRG